MGVYDEEDRKHPVPALLSLLLPGLGQITKGEVMKGFMTFAFTMVGYLACIVPGVFVHFWSIFDAYNHNSTRRRRAIHAVHPVDVQVRHGETEVRIGLGGQSQAQEHVPTMIRPAHVSSSRSSGFKFGGGLLAFVGVGLVIAGYFSGLLPLAISGVISSGFSALMIATAVRVDREQKEEQKRMLHTLHEKEILRLAISRGGRLTTSEVAAHTSLTLEEAKKVLESMAYEGHVSTSVSDGGALVYEFHEICSRAQEQDLNLQPKELPEAQPLDSHSSVSQGKPADETRL